MIILWKRETLSRWNTRQGIEKLKDTCSCLCDRKLFTWINWERSLLYRGIQKISLPRRRTKEFLAKAKLTHETKFFLRGRGGGNDLAYRTFFPS